MPFLNARSIGDSNHEAEVYRLCGQLELEMARLAGTVTATSPLCETMSSQRGSASRGAFEQLAAEWWWLTHQPGAVPGSDFPW